MVENECLGFLVAGHFNFGNMFDVHDQVSVKNHRENDYQCF